MILEEFSKHLKKQHCEVPPLEILNLWLKDKLSRAPKTNVEKIIHTEISIMKDKTGFDQFRASSTTGQNLLDALFNFAQSYEQQNFNRWLHKVKASDFKSQSDI